MHHPEPIEPESMFEGLRWRPILLGGLLDNALSIVAFIPLTFAFAGNDAFSADEEAANRAFDLASSSPEFLLAGLVLGCTVTVFAAYWAASRAGALHVRHGGWTAVTSAALASLMVLLSGGGDGGSTPLWYEALGLALMVPAGMLGGWCAARLAARAS